MSKELMLPSEPINLNNTLELVKFASELKGFIVDQKLYTNIKGKNFAHVEGWQFLFIASGLTPVVISLDRIEAEGEIKYKSVVDLIKVDTQQVVGRGIAICSNKESTKKSFDEYAIASMAQTRAIGKAGRSIFGFIMKAAGYEATPAEEMTDSVAAEPTAQEKEEIRVKEYIEASDTIESLKDGCESYIYELDKDHELRKLYETKLADLEAHG